MKKDIRMITFMLVFFLFGGFNNLLAQELIKPRISMSYFKKDDIERKIAVRVSARIERRSVMLEGAKIDIYHSEIADDNLLGDIITDSDGSGELTLPESFNSITDTTTEYLFIGVLENQPEYADAEKEIEIYDAFLRVDFQEDEDSTKIVDVTIFQNDIEEGEIPLEDIEIKVFAKRPFGDLPINKEGIFSDEDGNVQVVFPNDLPADSLESVKIFVRVEDDDTYGNLEISEIVDWGVAHEFDDDTLKRSLWAAGANAPIWLMVFVNALIFITWGIIFYIGYQIFRIYKT